MREKQADSKNVVRNNRNARFIGALLLGAFVGLFTGLITMSLAILLCSMLRLFWPYSTFQIVSMNITAVIFVVFFALGWVGGTFFIWCNLPPFFADA